ncbi:MAG: hypothetical protein AAF483_29110, partial [Planctomycetota bacterium]
MSPKLNILVFLSALIFAITPLTAQESRKMSNPLLQRWTGPYGGVPPWNLVSPNDFVSAFENAIAENNEEIAAIVENAEPANFANTVIALE